MSAPKHHADGFHARIHPSAPITTKGHAPGIKVGKDKIPEFHAETHPPGTAPPESTFKPNTTAEVAPPDHADQEGGSAALDMPGATSADVHVGAGKPLQGMEGRELSSQLPGKKHKGERMHPHGHRREGAGLVGIAPGAGGADPVRQHGWDLPEGVEKGTRGKASRDYPSAEERVPESSEQVASERPG